MKFKCTFQFFEQKLHEIFQQQPETKTLHGGYAPFCKHLFVPNFINAKLPTLKITDENKQFLESGYIARRAEELPILARWFPKDKFAEKLPSAKFLDVILYSREQIIKGSKFKFLTFFSFFDFLTKNVKLKKKTENEDMGQPEANKKENEKIPWGIVGIKPQDQDFEIPMQPITMIRNELGTEYGGSGQKIDKEQYRKSAEFWNTHADVL